MKTLIDIIVLCTIATSAMGERHALVIGNAAYTHSRALDNPMNDANDMAIFRTPDLPLENRLEL